MQIHQRIGYANYLEFQLEGKITQNQQPVAKQMVLLHDLKLYKSIEKQSLIP